MDRVSLDPLFQTWIQLLWCISRIILTVIFAKKYVHFSKHFIQTAPHNGLPAKACNLLEIFSPSLKSMSTNISVPSEWKDLVSLFTNKLGKMLSHVVNITVQSVSVTWCNLWQQSGWQLLYWNAEGGTSYECHTVYPFQKNKFTHYTVCGMLIEKDWIWFTVTLLLVVWQIKKKHYNVIVK